MVECEIPVGIQIGETQVSFNEIYQTFAATQHGDQLRRNVRYGTFRPTEVPQTIWERHLGPDVNNLRHLYLSVGLTKSFLAGNANPPVHWTGRITDEAKFNAEEQALLLFTAVTHDWAEAETGDIAYPLKTVSDEEQEMVILERLIDAVLGDKQNRSSIAQLTRQVQAVLSDKKSKLGKAFNAIERGGYVRTGIRAWHESRRTEGTLAESLQKMGREVVIHHIPVVKGYAEVYPATDTFLTYHSATISAICPEQ